MTNDRDLAAALHNKVKLNLTPTSSTDPPPTKTAEQHQREKSEREWQERVKNNREAWSGERRVRVATEYKERGNQKFRGGNVMSLGINVGEYAKIT